MTLTLGVDWGSTHLRIHRIVAGKTPQTKHAKQGARALIGKGAAAFEAVLREEARDWLAKADTIYVTGMATSKNAWIETPYMQCPSDLRFLAGDAKHTKLDGVPVTLLPGIADPAGPDIMRGEELQLIGLAEEGVRRLVVLPGTHSKWVEMEGYQVTRFRTFMTGETYEFARHTALCGRLGEGEEYDSDAFIAGLSRGQNSVMNALFSARPAVLSGNLPATSVSSFLSGVCIGAEFAEAKRTFDLRPTSDILLFAAPILRQRYQEAFEYLGLPCQFYTKSATLEGFKSVAIKGQEKV